MSDRTVEGTDRLTGATLRWMDEFAAQGIFTTDTSLVVRSWNRWLEDQTGHAARAVVGRPLFDSFPQLVDRGFESHYRAVLSGQARVLAHVFHRYLLPTRHAGASEPAQTARIAPLMSDDGVIGTITVLDDVSERVSSERELRSQIETAETARAIAEEAVRVKDEFLATLSHEIRTPLNAVLGWTKILLGRQVDQATMARALQVIDRNATAQSNLIDDMLDMARIMSGKLRLDMQPVDLGSIALAAIDVVTPTAAARQIELGTEIDEAAPWLVGDPDRLQQIVWNLLSNAIKFTEPGGRVTIGISRADLALKLWVRDTGRGISREFLPEIFERFRQADSSSSRRHGGLGLGLSLVRQLVELHGGHVAADSEPGRGSTFTITLPARTEVTAVDLATAPVAGADLTGVRVLLVEDQQDAREILIAALQHQGAVVTEATSTSEALAVLDGALQQGLPPQVIISDIGLPGEDGYRLIEQLGRRPRSSGGAIPAIAVTAYGRPQDKKRALAAGFQRHLTKPVTPEALAAALVSVLQGPASR